MSKTVRLSNDQCRLVYLTIFVVSSNQRRLFCLTGECTSHLGSPMPSDKRKSFLLNFTRKLKNRGDILRVIKNDKVPKWVKTTDLDLC